MMDTSTRADGTRSVPATVEVRHDRERRCGWRVPGAKYVVAAQLSPPCGKFPILLEQCPRCGMGLHRFHRGWQWCEPAGLVALAPCHDRRGILFAADGSQRHVAHRFNCSHCPLARPETLGRCGLLWVGQQHYPTPADFLAEAVRFGVSRKIPEFPVGFVAGETKIFLAHLKAIDLGTGKASGTRFGPGLFALLVADRLEYVTCGTETEEELQRLVERGVTPVRIERDLRSQISEGEKKTCPDL